MNQTHYPTTQEYFVPTADRRLETPQENRLEEVINTFRPINLREMDSVALLNRIDTKFVLATSQLLPILQSLKFKYQVLSIDNQRLHNYRTLYYDTHEFEFYHEHVTGRSEVYKVRSREYVDTQLAFLEIKRKDQKRRTEKSRLPFPYHSQYMNTSADNFLHGFVPFSSQDLEPKLLNTFKRMTLVSKQDGERLTIDLDLHFYSGEQDLFLDGIAIAEIKQDQYSKGSAFIMEMRRQGIRRTGFSKYCFGVSQLYLNVKKNSQKERALMIEKLQQRGGNYVF